MDFTTALGDIKQTVDRQLLQFFSTKRIEAEKIHPEAVQLVDAIADLTSRGGKRTRAFLVWLGHEAAGESRVKSKTSQGLLHAMMGIELFQSFALIHDDIIDQDTMRRGAPTVHKHFKQVALDSGNPRDSRNRLRCSHFGESMAILAGDLALVWADEKMAKRKTQNSNVKTDPLMIYEKMKEEVILGQSLDVLAANGLPSADRAAINRYKTAWYSVVRPLQIGAAIAGADEKTIASFVPYGLVVGDAYQLRDDFLDGEISEEEFQEKAKKLVVPKFATILFTEFANFVFQRSV